jgi:hypothetical protein
MAFISIKNSRHVYTPLSLISFFSRRVSAAAALRLLFSVSNGTERILNVVLALASSTSVVS